MATHCSIIASEILWTKQSGGLQSVHLCSVTKSHLTPCDCVDYSLPGSSVHGIFQTRILEWVTISFSRGSSHIEMELTSPESPALAVIFFTTETLGKPGLQSMGSQKVWTLLSD